MSLPLPHGLLTLPAPGNAAMRSLRRKVRLLAVKGLLESRPALRRPLEALLRQDPTAVLDAVGSPDVLPGLLAAQSGAIPAQAAYQAAIPQLLVALHVRGLRPPEPMIAAGAQILGGLPRGGAFVFGDPARAVLLDSVGLSIEDAQGDHVDADQLPTTQVAFDIPGTPVHLAVRDTNPVSFLEDHPDKHGNTVDLAGREVDQWLGALSESFAAIGAALPGWSAELPLALSRLLPVGFEPERHLSASYGDAPGIAYLTLHPSPLTMAEAIVHETQHGKLNLLLWLDQVLTNGRTEWTPSPVRPDLRPLLGVLLAVHAFIPVAALHARLADMEHPLADGPSFARRREQVLSGNEGGLAILRDKSEPTAVGARLLHDLEALHAATTALAPGSLLEKGALPPG